MKWSYLAPLGADDKVEWGDPGSDSVPPSGQLLPDIENLSVYLKIREHAWEGRYCGQQIDWGAYGIKVNGPQLLQILEECSGDHGSAMSIYKDFARSLGDSQYVAFISIEL